MRLDRVIAVRNSKTVYRDGDECIKVFYEAYSLTDILSEVLNQSRAAEMGLNVPKILGITTIDNRWAIVMEYVKGKTLAQLMEENPQKRDGYIKYLIDLQLGIHSKESVFLNKQKDKIKFNISRADVDEITREGLYGLLDSMPEYTKVCHGDFVPANVIIRDDGTPCIIDWSHMTAGSASADAAKTYLRFILDGSVEDAEKYLTLFCEKSKTDRQCIEKWMPTVAASQSVKGNERERKILLSFINKINEKINFKEIKNESNSMYR